MDFKQGSYKVCLLMAVDKNDDEHLVCEALERFFNEVNALKLENDNAVLIIEAMVQTEKSEDDEEQEDN